MIRRRVTRGEITAHGCCSTFQRVIRLVQRETVRAHDPNRTAGNALEAPEKAESGAEVSWQVE